MKRVITVQDISCVGKCSLSVALPVISALGVEAAALPTALLSTHTAFKEFSYKELTSQLASISRVFRRLRIGFDAIYTGYLGSIEQIDAIEEFVNEFKTDKTALIIDPVLGDHGRLYKGFSPATVERMAKFINGADLIVPNLTEAAFMLGIPFTYDYDEEYIKDILKRLCGLGAKRAALTGISFETEKIGFYYYDSITDEFCSYFNEKVPGTYLGTGDIFASTVTGAYVKGFSYFDALKLATDFSLECIKKTALDPEAREYGVNFEEALPMLIKRINK